ncbi:MAG: DUF4492 domain-containing protein [Mucinivorans sp.]
MATKISIFRRIWRFYYEGFASMEVGRTLWLVVLVKLAIMFLVLKIFFFPALLSDYSDQEKADFVSRELINRQEK